MKIRIQILFIGLLLLALPAALQAQFQYSNNGNGTCTITAYTGSDGAVAIPGIINGLTVTSIGDEAFAQCYGLTNVTIPISVTSIGDEAFAQCYGLTNVTIPISVTNIGDEAFAETALTNVTIPASVTSIGDLALSWCLDLTNIMVDAQNLFYSSVNGVLFDKSQTTLIQYPGGLGGSYTISNSVTSIGDGAFAECYGLTNVTIGNSVTNIGDSAFALCYGLTNVTIPNSVTSIGDEAFAETALTSVTIPNSVTSIGASPFIECGRLTNITVDAQNLFCSSVNGVLFDKSQTTLIQYPGGLGGSYTISNSVTSIEDNAFAECYGLTNVTIPNSVTSLGNDAFADTALTSVTIPNSVTSLGDGAFYSCRSLTAAFFQGNALPDDGNVFNLDPVAIVYYLRGTTGWGPTFGGAPTALWNPQAIAAGVSAGQFGFNITGPTNAVIVVEACTTLSNPVWLPVSTNTLSGSGASSFSDPQSQNYPNRFYRFRSP